MKKLLFISFTILSFSTLASSTFEDVKHMMGANEIGLVDAAQCDVEYGKEGVNSILLDEVESTAIKL